MMPKILNAASLFESEALRIVHCEYFNCKDHGSMMVTHKTEKSPYQYVLGGTENNCFNTLQL